MQVTVEVLSGLERKLTVTLPPGKIQLEVERRLKEMCGTVRIPGFRPNKVPLRVIRDRFGRSLRNEVLNNALQTSYRDAIAQEKLLPAGLLSMRLLVDQDVEPLTYEANIEVYPVVELLPLDGLELQRPVAEIMPADVERVLEVLRTQKATWVPVQRPAGVGDRLVITFLASVDGEPLERFSAKKVKFQIGVSQVVPGFSESLVGRSAGEEFALDLPVDESTHMPNLVGKILHFDVTVHDVLEQSLPELDESFAKGFDIQEGGLEQLRQEVLSSMEKNLAARQFLHLKAQLMEALSARYDFDVPNVLIQAELAKARIPEPNSEASPKAADARLVESRQMACERIRLGLVLGEYSKLHQITLDQRRVQAKLDLLVGAYQSPDLLLKQYNQDSAFRRNIHAAVLQDQVVERILQDVKQIDRAMPYQDLIKLRGVQEIGVNQGGESQ